MNFLRTRSRDQVRQKALGADVLLHGSLSEDFGNAVIEAQARALPVVCSDVGGLPDDI